MKPRERTKYIVLTNAEKPHLTNVAPTNGRSTKRKMFAYTRPGPERRTPYKNDIPATDPRRRLVKLRANGLLTTKYWNLYAEVDQIYNDAGGIVNGIPTDAPYFAEAVLTQIEIDGRIECFTKGHKKNESQDD